MAKDLPYFKFMTAEWLLGRIAHESDAVKGMFTDACAHYWHKECVVSQADMEKKLGKKRYGTLISLKYIESTGGGICIPFLDEQLNEFMLLKNKRSGAGKAGREAQLASRANAGQTPGKTLTGDSEIAGHLEERREEEIKGEREKKETVAPDQKMIFRIGVVEIMVPFSEYIIRNHSSFLEARKMQNGVHAVERALQELDRRSIGVTYREPQHALNTLDAFLRKLLENPVVTTTGPRKKGE